MFSNGIAIPYYFHVHVVGFLQCVGADVVTDIQFPSVYSGTWSLGGVIKLLPVSESASSPRVITTNTDTVQSRAKWQTGNVTKPLMPVNKFCERGFTFEDGCIVSDM